ncbi:MAG TPA: methylated-DNA--[protein]-cysteine S-methyltransferase [Labilithrix sp.]
MLESPIGRLVYTVERSALVRLAFDDAHDEESGSIVEERTARDVARALADWLGGDLSALDRLELAPRGTAFQKRVWDALLAIPHATTTTYGAIARAIGTPHAARAVGAANGANPIAIAIPCHRVVGADGTLTGYAFGVERKRWLLEHERRFAGNIRTRRVSSM